MIRVSISLDRGGNPQGAPMNESETTRERLLREVAEPRQPADSIGCATRQREEGEYARWEGEERYGILVETMNEALAVMNADGALAYVNDRLCELLGYTRKEILGQAARSVFSPDDQKVFDEQVAKRSSGESGSYKAELIRKDKTLVPVLISSRPIFDTDGRFAGSVALLTDISELRQAEEMLRVQCELAASLNATSDLNTALDLLLSTALQVEGIDGGGVYLVDRQQRQLILAAHRGLSQRFVDAVSRHDLDSPEGRLAMSGRTFFSRASDMHELGRSLLAEEGIRALLSIPVLAKEQTIAVMNVCSRSCDDILPRDRRLLESITGRMSGVIIRIQAEESLRESQKSLQKEQKLLKQLLELQERDRKLVAYEIHDGLAQLITGAYYRLQSFQCLHESKPEEAKKAFDEGLRLLDRCVDEVRNLISGLRPPVLDESGVVPAIEYLIRESQKGGGPEIEFHHKMHGKRLPGPLETAVFRIVQESLTNARRHSHSDRVRLDLTENRRWLKVEVRDWGVGFEPQNVESGHFGLEGIRERARLLGGRSSIESSPGNGTHIVVEIPLSDTTAAKPALKGGKSENGRGRER